MHWAQPVKDFDTGWDCNHHGSKREKGDAVGTHSDREHVMGPHPSAHESDHYAGRNHHWITEDRFPGKDRHDFRDYAKSWQHEDIDFRMAEDPEKVLPQNRGATGLGFEKLRAKKSLKHQHDLTSGNRRMKSHNHEHEDQAQPDKKAHPVKGQGLTALTKNRHHGIATSVRAADS